jgi:DNA-binding MarR family transcriptional regulator
VNVVFATDEDREQRVLRAIRSNPDITKRRLLDLTVASPRLLDRLVGQLEKKGLVTCTKHGGNRGFRYNVVGAEQRAR